MKILQSDNSSFFLEEDSISKFTPSSAYSGNLTAQAETIDSYTFDKVQKLNKRANAAFYIENLDAANKNYQGIVFVNSTSQEVAGSYVQVLATAFLKQFLLDSGKPDPNLKITYNYKPFPLSA